MTTRRAVIALLLSTILASSALLVAGASVALSSTPVLFVAFVAMWVLVLPLLRADIMLLAVRGRTRRTRPRTTPRRDTWVVGLTVASLVVLAFSVMAIVSSGVVIAPLSAALAIGAVVLGARCRAPSWTVRIATDVSLVVAALETFDYVFGFIA